MVKDEGPGMGIHNFRNMYVGVRNSTIFRHFGFRSLQNMDDNALVLITKRHATFAAAEDFDQTIPAVVDRPPVESGTVLFLQLSAEGQVGDGNEFRCGNPH